MAFIIDTYNKYDKFDKEHSVYTFALNENWYAIKKVEVEWGIPKLGIQVDRDTDMYQYWVYSTYEEALQFVRKMKQIN